MLVTVHQLVYGKLPKEQSPQGRGGFQTLLYPKELFQKKELLELESRIHYPGPGVFTQKWVVCWLTLQGEVHQVMLRLLPQPEAVDEFGRKGLFLVHGWVLPPALWQTQAHPLTLAPMLEAHLCHTLAEVQQRAGDQWARGEMPPQQLDIQTTSAAQSTASAQALEAALAMHKLATGTAQTPLALQGPPDQVAEAWALTMTLLPRALWPALGIDTGFDGGKLYFFPLKVVGYSATPPTTGQPLEWDVVKGAFKSHPEGAELKAPRSLYERWLAEELRQHNLLAPGATDRHAAWATALSQSQALQQPTEPSAAFWHANATELERLFMQQATGAATDRWAQALASHLRPDAKLALMATGMTGGALAQALFNAILTGLLAWPALPEPPPVLLQQQHPQLAALCLLWQKPLDLTRVIAQVGEAHVSPLYHYLALSTWHQVPEVMQELLRQPRPMVSQWLENSPFYQAAAGWLARLVPSIYEVAAVPISLQALHEGTWADPEWLEQGAAGWLALAENSVGHPLLQPEHLSQLRALAVRHKPDPEAHPQLMALLDYQLAVPLPVIQRPDLRAAWLKHLVQAQVAHPQLMALGFGPDEIAQMAQAYRPGLLQRLKGLFTRRR